MNTTSTINASKLYELNDRFTETRAYRDIPTYILDPMAELIGAETGVFALMRKAKSCVSAGGFISFGIDHRCTDIYREHFQQDDPVLPHAFNSTKYQFETRRRKAFTFTLDNIVDRSSFAKGEYYNDFLRPNSIRQILAIGIPSSNDNSLVYVMGFHRHSNRPFSSADALHSSYMGPALYSVFSDLELKSKLHEQMLISNQLASQATENGLVVLDMSLQVIFANFTGQKHLAIKQQHGTQYLPLSSDIKHTLHKALEAYHQSLNVARTDSFNYELHIQGIDIQVRVQPNPMDANKPRLVLYTRKPLNESIDPARIKRFSLTQREVGIATLVMKGLTNPQIAEQLSISIRTVENHLRSIYSKLGVHNRTSMAYELVPSA